MARRKQQVERIYVQYEGPNPPLEVTIDRQARAIYVRVRLGSVAQTVEVQEGVLADVDRDGQLLGVELLKPVTKAKVFDRIASKYEVPGFRAVGTMAEALTAKA